METLKYLKGLEIDRIYPSPCTGLAALTAFSMEFIIRQLKTGVVLEI